MVSEKTDYMDFPLSGALNPQKFSLRQGGAVLA